MGYSKYWENRKITHNCSHLLRSHSSPHCICHSGDQTLPTYTDIDQTQNRTVGMPSQPHYSRISHNHLSSCQTDPEIFKHINNRFSALSSECNFTLVFCFSNCMQMLTPCSSYGLHLLIILWTRKISLTAHRSHCRPTMLGLHWHWPVTLSHVALYDPKTLQSQAKEKTERFTKVAREMRSSSKEIKLVCC